MIPIVHRTLALWELWVTTVRDVEVAVADVQSEVAADEVVVAADEVVVAPDEVVVAPDEVVVAVPLGVERMVSCCHRPLGQSCGFG